MVSLLFLSQDIKRQQTIVYIVMVSLLESLISQGTAAVDDNSFLDN
jgi:hypothetical protein